MLKIPVMIIPTIGNHKGLNNLLKTIDFPVENIVVIDNGSNLESISCTFAEKVSIVNLPSNIGVSSAWNLGVKLFPYSEYWLVVGDDLRFLEGSLERIVSMVKPERIIDIDGRSALSAFVLHESVVRKVGLFDEFYFPGVGEEFSYLHRCELFNIEHIKLNDAVKGATGTSRNFLISQSDKWDQIMQKNYQFSLLKKGRTIGFDLRHRRSIPF